MIKEGVMTIYRDVIGFLAVSTFVVATQMWLLA